MFTDTTFAVIGGDLRQAHLAGLLAADGLSVLTVGFERKIPISSDVLHVKNAAEAVERAHCVILPLPFTVDGSTVNAPFSRAPIPLQSIWEAADHDPLITGGMLSPDVVEAARTHGFRTVDYYAKEEMAVRNTVPTVEGALQIAFEELPITLHGTRCLVLGFGRVGRTLCRSLRGLGAEVTGCARSYDDLAWVRTLDCTPLRLDGLTGVAGRFDVVFNTIPARILTAELLTHLKKGCLVIDLASKPGGVDFDAAKQLGVKTVWALSLPGKVAPHTAGQIIKETVLHILEEEGLS
ncbi:dipicolinate synthase subunit DpsA [Ethanoligenens sp.]|uniref:dipicolinate synthase subunit DpsA n=1 Tax=Ethanoligenens sp. TaxID=2099655 RepID=UPI0039E79DB6